ncbi:hypothetical protein [Methylocella silvestris]|uniref:N-acetyltransferase domain-containing protein n=1 Tax=Methylocella silvestris TaxID=199596 RepID=A0A2J7TK03_METSI|nr:hypothetical protein [Methylocella silvestris]PNG27095.1 hypothetical protein CR492_05240 [Methylocella silvestris]
MNARPGTAQLSAVEIVEADGVKNFLAFCRLPRQLYKGMEGFAPPLDAERWTIHGARLNPHFKLVEWQGWLALKGGKLVGRIMAQIYKPEVPAPIGAPRAQFGCLDAIDDDEVVAALTQTAEGWVRARGEKRICGPFSPSINGELGLLVEGFDARPMVFMTWNPPYLVAALERLGYVKARDLLSYRYEVTQKDREARPSVITRPEWRDRLKIRELRLNNMAEEAKIIVDIFNDAWAENWGFVPFTLEEFMSSAESLRYIMPPEGGVMIELDGVPQAFAVVLPNLHEITADLDGRLFPFGLPKVISRLRKHKFSSGRLLLFGVRRALQRKAVGGAVILAFIEEIRRRSATSSYSNVEFGWVLEDNMGMRRPIELAGARIDKVHRIYEKSLAA